MPSRRVLAACSLGGAGHLQPLLPFLTSARQRGHETLVVGPAALREMVERAGHTFAAGGEPPEQQIAPIRERLPIVPPEEASILGNRDLFAELAATAMRPAMERLCAEWAPDLVLRDPCEYASAIVATGQTIQHAQVAISLAQAEEGSIAVASPVLEKHLPGLSHALRASPYLTRFPASLDPSPFPRTIRYRETPSPVGSPPAWWTAAAPPRLYMSFGTVLGHMSIAISVLRTALKAVEDLDVRALLTVGRVVDPAELGPIPHNVHVEAWVDQRDVLGTADVVVCHGGSGTAFGALAAGVPVVVVPVFADQFENGRRIADVKAGVTVPARDRADGSRLVIDEGAAPRIAAAIRRVLTDPPYRAAAARIAAEMAAVPTVDELLDGPLSEAPAAS